MATNQQTLLRQWHMLRLIPRAPAKITVQDLRAGLSKAVFLVTLRTVQRDLNELSLVFPLTVDDRDKPFGWSWQRDAQSFDLPGLQLDEALMLTMVEQHLQNQLPPSTISALAPYFRSAARTLANTGARGNAKAWLNKARSIPTTQPLVAPAIRSACQQTIYHALMCDQQLAIHYRKRAATKTIFTKLCTRCRWSSVAA